VTRARRADEVSSNRLPIHQSEHELDVPMKYRATACRIHQSEHELDVPMKYRATACRIHQGEHELDVSAWIVLGQKFGRWNCTKMRKSGLARIMLQKIF